MVTTTQISHDVAAIKDETIALRRQFHQIPELAFEEAKTADLIATKLRELKLPVKQGIGKTGVLGWLDGAKPGKTLMMRADMDALPLSEPQDRPYRSTIENRNHACGHDMNMALLLGTAKVLAAKRDRIAGRVAFVFQPADEPQIGARSMIEAGLLKEVKPDFILSHHPMDIPAGKVVAQAGPLWASADVLKLIIKGDRGDFSLPESGTDAALMAAEVVTSLYAAVHRHSPPMEPVMFRVQSIQTQMGPGTDPPQAEVRMRLATFNRKVQASLMKRIEQLIAGTVSAMGGTFTLENTHSLPPIINDPAVASAVIAAANHVVGAQNVIQDWRNYFSDDLALFFEAAPGCLFLLGTQAPTKGITGRQHRPEYDIDEDTLAIGVEIMSRAALELLK